MTSRKLDFSALQLYGRDNEINALYRAYEGISDAREGVANRLRPEIVLVHGYSGTGKSALVNSLRMPVKRNTNALFVSGKFDEIRAPKPYSALADAFTELCNRIAESQHFERIRDELSGALGEDNSVLINVIPAFQTIFGQNRNAVPLGHQQEWGFEKLKMLFRSFLRVTCHPSHPVVLFIDDLQWADAASLELIKFLITDDLTDGLLYVGSYRDHELERNHPLSLHLRELDERHSEFVTRIHVRDLDVHSLNQLVAGVTRLRTEATQPLAEVVHRKTHGNVFFAIQFLRSLQDEGFLHFSVASFKWEWNMDQIESETNISDNVVDFVAGQIQRLPQQTQDVLKIAACLGSHFDCNIIASVVESGIRDGVHDAEMKQLETAQRIADCLDMAATVGLVDRRRETMTFKFAHDRIQQGAYSLLPEGQERDELHLRIGRLIRTKLESAQVEDWMLLLAADQLNRGSGLIVDKTERIELANLNLRAANNVIRKSAFIPAADYARAALALIDGERKWEDHYGLTLQLCTTLAEMEYCVGNFGACQKMVDEVLSHATSLSDKLRAYFTRVEAIGAEGDLERALRSGFEVLRQLGVRMPRNPGKLHVVRDLLRAKRLLRGKSDDDLLNLPRMTDSNKVAAMKMMSLCATFAWYLVKPDHVGILCLREMIISLKHGINKLSAHAFANFGLILGILGDFRQAYRFGRLSLNLLERTNAVECSSRALCVVHSFLQHLQKPVHTSIDPILYAYQIGMETGDIKFAAMNASSYGMLYLFCGLNLAPLKDDMRAFGDQMARYSQTVTFSVIRVYHQAVLNLMNESNDPLKLSGDAMTEEDVMREALETNNTVTIHSIWFLRMILGYYFGNLDQAGENANLLLNHGDVHGTNFYMCIVILFSGLTELALAQTTRKRKHKRRARTMMKRMEKWVKSGAPNCLHMHLMLCAEYAILMMKPHDSIKEAYGLAIARAAKSGFTHHAALANERLGIFFFRNGDMEYAGTYLRRARTLYADWGAQAKVVQLESNYELVRSSGPDSSEVSSSHFQSRTGFSSRQSELHQGASLRGMDNARDSFRSTTSFRSNRVFGSSRAFGSNRTVSNEVWGDGSSSFFEISNSHIVDESIEE